VLRPDYIDPKGGTFMKRLSIGLAAAAGLAALTQGVAAAGPTPQYDVTCVIGGQTSVAWSHAKVTAVTLEWFTAGSETPYATATPPVTTHRPRGSVLTSAGTLPGIVPASVLVTFERAKAAEPDVVTAACA
jgi:hypothetical protein